ADQCEVQPAGADQGGQLTRRPGRSGADGSGGMGGGEAFDQAAEDRPVRRADAEAGRSGVAVGEAHRLLLQFPYGGQQDAGTGEDEFAEGGRAGAVAVTFEEGASEGA